MYVIVGMPRSGSISLHQYLLDKGFDVKRDECIFRDDAIRHFKQRWDDATPVIIFRNPVDRCWSWYHYLKPDMSYLRFLKKEYRNNGFGELNPIKQCNMKKWITPWLELKPKFFSFENMIKVMPLLNKGETPFITKPHIDITKELLRQELCKE